MKRVLAFDFGASSGRAIIGKFDGNKITLEEIHRFENNPVMLPHKNGATFHWDFLRLFYEVGQGINKAKLQGGFDSIGIDTWGVDFGLLDKNGRLLENPVHYRDERTTRIARPNYYARSGIQAMAFNTVYQLSALQQERPELLKRASSLLFMPDLFAYFLSGEKNTEASIASTSGLVDLHTRKWNKELLGELKLPKKLFGKIQPSGRVIGKLRDSNANVISICGHDTASAVVAVPTTHDDFLYLSCGTWSLLGTEIASPILTNENITNEGGYGGKIRYLKNISGLWLIGESRRQWKREGRDLSFMDIENQARVADAKNALIDPNFPDFAVEGNLPAKIQQYCRDTQQEIPQTVGEIARTIYESLAQTYAQTVAEIETATGKNYPALNMIGGGIKDKLLCELTAKRCKRQVFAGPTEATALGNIAVQLITAREIKNIKQAREVIRNSIDIAEYKN